MKNKIQKFIPLVMLLFFACAQKPSPYATVLFHTGDVDIVRNEQKITCEYQATVQPGDIITTGKNSEIILQIKDQAVVRIQPGTVFVFDSIDQTKNGKTRALLKEGSVFSKITKKSNYSISTRTITASVRGTEFLVTTNRLSSRALLRSGEIRVSLNKNEKDHITLTAGNKAVLYSFGPIHSSALNKIEKLTLDRLAVVEYVPGAETIKKSELVDLFSQYREKEKEIQKKIDLLIEQWEQMSPLERLRAQGRHISRFTMRDSSVIIGSIISQSENAIVLDTGEGVIQLPKSDIIRRKMIK